MDSHSKEEFDLFSNHPGTSSALIAADANREEEEEKIDPNKISLSPSQAPAAQKSS